MAEQDRKPPHGKGKQPISRHPLFPATIALWFGALFGLGSMAIRPGLLETVVVSSGIDAIIPAAAPPLGMTARILLALLLAGIGGLAGAMLARRIARPAPEVRARTRGAASRFGADDASAAPRRRPLTSGEETVPAQYHDRAPLPGSSLQILNVNEVALEEPDAEPVFAAARRHEPDEDTLELTECDPVPPFTAPARADLTGSAASAAQMESSEVPVRKFSAPDFSVPKFEPTAFEKQVFAPAAPEADDTVDTSEPEARPFDAPAEFARPFERPTASEPDPAPAEPASPHDDETEQAQAAPVNPLTAIFAELTAGSTRLFDAPAANGTAMPAPHAPEASVTGSPGEEMCEPQVVQAPGEAAESGAGDDAVVVPLDEAAAATELQGFVLPDESAAERIACAELGSLSQVELLERLGLSLERRRKRASEAEALARQQALAVPAPEPADEENEAPAATDFVAEVPSSPIPPVFEVPAALRPLVLEEIGDDDVLPAFVPPRHIAMPPAVATEAERDVAACEAADSGAGEPGLEPGPDATAEVAPDTPETPSDDADDEETRVLEDGYSSLLNLSRPIVQRQEFVRIEEPADETSAIEPVVVFPGQSAVNRAPASPEPAEFAGSPAVGTARPFDPPQANGAAARPAAARPDPEETERALRAALASLQRMSGAA